jgi:hypothetical protein
MNNVVVTVDVFAPAAPVLIPARLGRGRGKAETDKRIPGFNNSGDAILN